MGCPPGATYDTAQRDPFPSGRCPDEGACSLIKGCRDAYPIVVCALPGVGRNTDGVALPAFGTFINLLSAAPAP